MNDKIIQNKYINIVTFEINVIINERIKLEIDDENFNWENILNIKTRKI